MRIKIECEEGPRKGDQFTIKDEVIIGRKKVDLSLRDSKASSEHAKIFFDSEGLPTIQDLKSANGTRVNGELISVQTLKAGDLIAIGSSVLKVLEVGENKAQSSTPQATKTEIVPWVEAVSSLLQDSLLQNDNSKPAISKELAAFSPVLELEVRRGIALGQKFTLGFGPRRIGKACEDLVLQEKLSPDIAFEIVPDHNGQALFRTNHADKVLLNKKSVKSAQIKDGDLVSVGNTVIAINFLDKAHDGN